ncbi:hypothetical protein OHA61_21075 [Streptomyces sp. NBC_00885]|uniref:hypothetical protein n=1 Tax=Streptomyces sp. NBC_00885 TaxID=2975857 RepID=UPI00386DFA7E|nr:hypothetical protein OHA61_21075 [Streptomyces sp. NBC_00885]
MLVGTLAASAVVLAPGWGQAAGAPSAPSAAAPVPAAGARLATGERLEVVPARGKSHPGFRIVPKRQGEQIGQYAFSTAGGRLQVQPVGLKKPAKATTVGIGAPTRSATAPRAALAAYAVKIQLANADHFGPIIQVWDRKTWTHYEVDEEQFGSSGKVSLPPGDYITVGMFSNWQQPDHLLTKTFTVRDRGVTVTLDASIAKETGITADDSSARRYAAAVWMRMPNGDIVGFLGGWGNKVYVTPLSLPGASLRVHEVLVKAGTTGNNPSPYRYNLFHAFPGGVPASPKVQVRTADLARTVTTLRSAGDDTTGWFSSWADVSDSPGVNLPSPVRFPSTVTEYTTPGQAFGRSVSYDGGPTLDAKPRTLPKGTGPDETFGVAPFAARPFSPSGAVQRGSKLSVYEPWAFSDTLGHEGTDFEAVQDFLLTSRGTKIAEVKDLEIPMTWTATVPQTRTPYELTHTVRHKGRPTRFSTRQTTEWAFSSDGYSAYEGKLPLADVDVRVDGLDIRNAAGAAPITIEAVATSRTAGATPTVTGLDYSADDGATWTALPVADSGGRASAELSVPQGARYISLRVSGKDSEGSSVRRTVVRAFAGPAPTSDETVGSTRITNVVVNNGRVIAPVMYDDPNKTPYTVRYTVTDPAGLADTGVLLHRSDPGGPDAVIRTWAPVCTTVDATTSACEAPFQLNARSMLGRNDLAGEWKAAIWARSLDGRSFTDQSDLGTAQILRETRVTINAPTVPVTKGTAFTVSGIAGIADWSTGRWNALPGKTVQLEFRKPGTSAYTIAAKVTADATGTVTSAPKAAYDANWRWLLPRTAGVGAAASPVVFVDVR